MSADQLQAEPSTGVGEGQSQGRSGAQLDAGTGNSRTSKSDKTVGQRAATVRAQDSIATAIGEPLEMAEAICGNRTTPEVWPWPPDAARLPTSPAGSVISVTSGVRTLVVSPVGLAVEHPADWVCHDGRVKNGQTSRTPALVPVVAKVAKMPSVPGFGGPEVGGLGSLDGNTASVVVPVTPMAASWPQLGVADDVPVAPWSPVEVWLDVPEFAGDPGPTRAHVHPLGPRMVCTPSV